MWVTALIASLACNATVVHCDFTQGWGEGLSRAGRHGTVPCCAHQRCGQTFITSAKHSWPVSHPITDALAIPLLDHMACGAPKF